MIKKIVLKHFKKHEFFEAKLNNEIILLHGNNATGKTSILEAISLFAPGKNIFNNEIEHLVKFNSDYFHINIHANFSAQIEYNAHTQSKQLAINGVKKKVLDSLEYMKIYAINPYIALAFWQDAALRRKYIDRLIMQHDNTYAVFCSNYTKARQERNKLIELNQMQYCNQLDCIIAENGIKIATIRNKILEKIQNNCTNEIQKFIENEKLLIQTSPTLEKQLEIFSAPLPIHFIGPHLTKFTIGTEKYEGTKDASTGQQKKLLLALTIAAFNLSNETLNVLLLDDLFCHLDNETVQQLVSLLRNKNLQTWTTNILNLPSLDLQAIELH